MRYCIAGCLVLLYACGARTDGLIDEAPLDASRPPDAPVALDAPRLDTGPPPTCEGQLGFGSFEGFVPPGSVSFPYVMAGIEAPTTHSCPRFFLRAGTDAMFLGDTLDIEVPYPVTGPFEPGPRMGTLSVTIDGEVWTEMIEVDVRRADGLFDSTLPSGEWRGSAEIHYHDATTDLEASIVDIDYRPCFPICI